MKVVVVGWGVTGQAVCRYLRARGDDVTVVDDRPSPEAARSVEAAGARLVASPGRDALRRLVGESALVVPSPGVPAGHPVHAVAAEVAVPVRSEIELAWGRLVSGDGWDGARPRRLVAVTGTNGKTTVTTLVAAMLHDSGVTALAAGNIGLPLIEATGEAVEVVVAEVSSFQLKYTEEFRPDVSCWLNLAEDHLDWHPSMADYAGAKARIWAAQRPGDIAVLGAADGAVMAAADDPDHGVPAGVERRTFSASGPADYHLSAAGVLVGPGDAALLAVDTLPRALPHDIANALAAVACALGAGGTTEGAVRALGTFETLPHRVELIGEADGVRWYDDSKATTPASVLAAVAGFDSVVLIAGGRNKGLHLDVLASTVPPVHAVVAIGEAAEEVREAFAGRGAVDVDVAGSMAEAVAAAARRSRPGDAVLLSPGCASFDWYHSYAERGEDFRAAVAATIGAAGSAR